MPSLNFKKENVPKVLSREKNCTIRPRGKRLYKKGDRLYLYVGLRTKGCRKLGEADCIKVDCIRIYTDTKEVIVNGVALTLNQVDELAKMDGFDDRDAFFRFFKKQYRPDPEIGFDGQLVWWDPAWT